MKNHFMALRLWRAACLTSAIVLAGAPVTQLVAQITSSSIAGVLRTAAGAPIANATITATHVPTGTTYTAVTSAQGRYNFLNVIVGGPYTVSTEATAAQSAVAKNISAQLGSSSEVNLVAGESEVVVLDALEVTAATNDLNPASAGAGNQYSSAELATRPTSERSLADLVSASPFVTIRALSGDREEANITALGQNNRYNSFQIDGSRINDQFGLNSTGLASFFNPISIEWIEQLAVQVSPYDVRQAGFTGASINAVTKSGSNQFSGGSYYLFQGDNAFGVQTRGENANEKTLSNRTVKPKLDQSTYGFYLGGPIIPDRLFFFAGYEKFKRESAPRDATFRANDEAAILTRLAQYNTASGRSIPWGAPVTGATSNIAEDEKVMVKLDWNIINSQRVSVRYLTAEGQVPQFGRFGGTSLTTNLSGFPSSGVTTTPTGGFYSQERKEESWAASLNSQWTPDFKSELKYATTKQDQTTPTAVTAPEIYIFNLPGTDLRSGAAVTNGGYVLGTEQFRHGNQINVTTDQYSYVADYINGDIVYSAGVEREESEFYNLFRQSSYGRIGYSSLTNFLNDVVAASERNVYDPAIRPVADVSEFATTGVFAQADWDISSRFKVTAGLRYEVNSQPDAPKFNQKFLTDTGFRNDGTLDGAEYISPRLSFNYSVDDKRITQIRGGAGHFTGRAPWVFFSNSYGQTGVGSFTQANVAASGLTNYLQNSFNPASPSPRARIPEPTAARSTGWMATSSCLPSGA